MSDRIGKRKFSLPFIITACAVGAVAITVLILCLIPIRPFAGLPKYDAVTFYDLDSAYQTPVLDRDKLKKGIEKTDFNVMHAMLEGKFNYNYYFKTKTEKDGDEKKTVRAKLTPAEINAINATSEKYMLLFEYKDIKTLNVEGEKVSFNRIKVLIPDYQGEIGKIEFVPYIYDKVNGDPLDELYTSTPIVSYCYTNNLFNALKELASNVK